MYDAVAEAVPMAQSGRNRKKAVVIISDGNDTSSRVGVGEVRQLVRETEVLVYAVGIDGKGTPTLQRGRAADWRRAAHADSLPGSGGGRGGGYPMPPFPGTRRRRWWRHGRRRLRSDDHVNVTALREMTDDSGGRTEIVRDPRDLDPAVASIADELSQQYYIGYPSPGHKDGRWHTIRVEVRDPALRVRARRGYIATP